jgi:protein-disulfide isomerase
MFRREFLAVLPAALLTLPGLPALAQGAGDIDTSGVAEMVLGAADAPLEVIEYASFTCPHCASFHKNVFKELKADYVDTGKVRFVYREVYFDKFGLWAGMVARCGGEARYFGIVDMLYDRQREWTKGEDATQIVQNLRKIGKLAGVTDDELDACLSDNEKARAMVARYQENAAEHDINSTPSFVIDGQKYSNMAYEQFRAILDEKLGS